MKGFVFILLIASAAADKNALRARREADRIAHEKAVAEEAAKAAHEAMLSNQAKADAALIAAHLVEQQKLRDATAARLSKPFQNKVRADYSNTYFSNSLSSSDSHGPVEYRVMPVGTPNMCLAVPKADSKSGLRNGQVVILETCSEDPSQIFSYDGQYKYIFPGTSRTFCLDFEIDGKANRPMTVFRCDHTFAESAKKGHQEWTWTNSSTIINSGTKKCLSAGNRVYDGKALESAECTTDAIDQQFKWVPIKWYRAINTPEKIFAKALTEAEAARPLDEWRDPELNAELQRRGLTFRGKSRDQKIDLLKGAFPEEHYPSRVVGAKSKSVEDAMPAKALADAAAREKAAAHLARVEKAAADKLAVKSAKTEKFKADKAAREKASAAKALANREALIKAGKLSGK